MALAPGRDAALFMGPECRSGGFRGEWDLRKVDPCGRGILATKVVRVRRRSLWPGRQVRHSEGPSRASQCCGSVLGASVSWVFALVVSGDCFVRDDTGWIVVVMSGKVLAGVMGTLKERREAGHATVF